MDSLSDLDERPNPIIAAEVAWTTPVDQEAPTDHRNASAIGVGVAVVICLSITAVGWLVTPWGWLFGIAGLPATTFLAWRTAPRIVVTDDAGTRQSAVLMGFGTILLSDLLVAIIATSATLVSIAGAGSSAAGSVDPVAAIAGALGVGLLAFGFGAVFVGIPAGIVVLPAAVVWAALVRRLVRTPPSNPQVVGIGMNGPSAVDSATNSGRP